MMGIGNGAISGRSCELAWCFGRSRLGGLRCSSQDGLDTLYIPAEEVMSVATMIKDARSCKPARPVGTFMCRERTKNQSDLVKVVTCSTGCLSAYTLEHCCSTSVPLYHVLPSNSSLLWSTRDERCISPHSMQTAEKNID